MKTKTKTLFATLAAATAMAALAAPAGAQSYGDRSDHARYEQGRYEGRSEQGRWDRGSYDIDHRQVTIENKITAGVRNGSLTRREVSNLREEFRDIARLEAHYRVGGLNGAERADLDRRFDRLEAQIKHDRTDNDDRRYGSGYGNHYDNRR